MHAIPPRRRLFLQAGAAVAAAGMGLPALAHSAAAWARIERKARG
jgi:hypothetical protein